MSDPEIRALLREAQVDPSAACGARLVAARARLEGWKTPEDALTKLLRASIRDVNKRRKDHGLAVQHPTKGAFEGIVRLVSLSQRKDEPRVHWNYRRAKSTYDDRNQLIAARLVFIHADPRLGLVTVGARAVLCVTPKPGHAWHELKGSWNEGGTWGRARTWALDLQPDRVWLTFEQALALGGSPTRKVEEQIIEVVNDGRPGVRVGVAVGRRRNMATSRRTLPELEGLRSVVEEVSVRLRSGKIVKRKAKRFLFPGARSPFPGGRP